MPRPPKFLEAEFEQVLLYADGPQVILLSSVSDTKLIAVAIEKYEDFADPFFAAQISLTQFYDYVGQKFDLRYLLLKPDLKRHFVFDFDALDDKIAKLSRVKLTAEMYDDYLPGHGLFSRHHTEKLSTKLKAPDSEQVFGVDGSWDLAELSSFYNKVTDLYLVYNGIDVYEDEGASYEKKETVKNAFMKPYEGGGSYVSLYDSLAAAQTRETRLRVSGIRYHSPGYVKLSGHAKPFTEIKSLITNLEANNSLLYELAKDLKNILRSHKLLKMNSNKFRTGTKVEALIRAQSAKLSKALDVTDYETILGMSSGNVLIAAKVLLSIHRRALKLNEFFLEGRIMFDLPADFKNKISA